MPNRITPIEVDSIYHIYNRGVNKELIFFSERNYQFFIYKMVNYMQDKASILAYCMMPNHYHLLVKIKNTNFVQKGLQPFLISYTNSINIDQKRIGPLFQGRYQANLVFDDAYLLECVKYIHLNPVSAGLVRLPQEWEYSSYRDYLSPQTKTFVDKDSVLTLFSSTTEFKDFSESELLYTEPKHFFDY
ncbi:MAG: transposase [Chloroflexi bacterium HGW-Chloroflexi-5]|jgi:REP element-mobilizing transposase RayT|nr:MAG: transposase [Chloroflexi bacterium HGW-Chloroflexi-5]